LTTTVFDQFIDQHLTSFWPPASFNLIASGLWFYGYNELATMVR
jgi:hypothetical protein